MKLTLTGFVRGLFGFMFPQRKKEIDWKYIGQLRSRLSNMKLEVSPLKAVASPTRTVPMLQNFRSLNERVSDRHGLKRWYGKDDAEQAEKELHARIEAGQRSVQEMKMSGQFPAIREEDAALLREVHSKYIAVGQAADSQSTEDKLAAFLSGASDDFGEISHMLFSGQFDASVADASTFAGQHGQYVNAIESSLVGDAVEPLAVDMSLTPSNTPALGFDADETLQNMPAVTGEVIASLERAHQIDATNDESVQDNARSSRSSKSRSGKGRKARSKARSKNSEDATELERVAVPALCAVSHASPERSEDLVESLPPSNVAIFRPSKRSKK